MDNIFNIFLQHPLFMGINRGALIRIFEKNRFVFKKYQDGEIIAAKGSRNDTLKCILSGEIRIECVESNNVKIVEELYAPQLIDPEYFFGIDTFHPQDVYAKGETGTLEIERELLYKISKEQDILFMNLLNLTSRRSQRKAILMDNSYSKGDCSRLQSWVLSKTHPGGRNISIHAAQEDLCKFLGISTENISEEMRCLKRIELMANNTGEMRFPDRRRLYEHFTQKEEIAV